MIAAERGRVSFLQVSQLIGHPCPKADLTHRGILASQSERLDNERNLGGLECEGESKKN